MAVPAGVDEAGGGVNQESQTAETALALQSRYEIVGQPHPLERRAEHELAGMEDERPFVAHLDQLGQLLLGLPDVDERVAGVVEDAEVAVDADVDAGGLQERLVVGVDLDAALGEETPDRPIGEDHGPMVANRPDRHYGSLALDLLQPVNPNERYYRRRRMARRRRRIRRALAGLVLVGLAAGFAFSAHSLTGKTRGAKTVAVTKPVHKRAVT